MIEMRTHVNNKDPIYEVIMSTDNKEYYLLVQYLIRNLIDNKECSVTVTDKLDPNIEYINSVN